jgi:hypothetical protein
MISTVDKLLLTADQQAQMERLTEAYNASSAIGDQAGMAAAHRQAEELRAAAGYSGGESGDRYELLKAANAPAGYSPYEDLVGTYANAEMHRIASGYQDALSQLDLLREQQLAEGKENQAKARSAVWNVQRLAQDGLLTRGFGQTGIADAITALALNQASANAYQAMLDLQNDLDENSLARTEARIDALGDASELERELGERLGDAYSRFYTDQTDHRQEQMLQQMKQAAAQQEQDRDYYYKLALAELKRQWELEDQAKGL